MDGEETFFCFFQTAETGNRTPGRGWYCILVDDFTKISIVVFCLISRLPPADERRDVTEMLNSIYTCNISSWPKSMFFHPYALRAPYKKVPALDRYMQCVVPHLPSDTTSSCNCYVRNYCGHNFRDPTKIPNMDCKSIIKEGITNVSNVCFSRYDVCINDHYRPLSHCIPRLQTACQTSQLRVVKTVRATMEEVEPLLQNDPNFRLLHLYRDPRAVYRSRRVASWTRGRFESNSTDWNTGLVYCQTVLHDYRKRKELEIKYPGRIKAFVYDEFILDPLKSKNEVYNFLDMPVDLREQDELSEQKDPQAQRGSRWQGLIWPDVIQKIESACQELADTIGVKWRKDT